MQPPQNPSRDGNIPPNQYEAYGNSALGNGIPRAELHNPKGPLQIGDATISIEGELVPVVDVMLGNQLAVYFEHHILLWKHPGVQIASKQLKGLQNASSRGCKYLLLRHMDPATSHFHAMRLGK